MTYYLLPRTHFYLYQHLQYDCAPISDSNTNCIVSKSLAHYLYAIKENIDDKDRHWDVFKKYTNPYEYIHTVVPFRKKCVAKHKPLSRSYFKMIELCKLFHLLPQPGTRALQTFHLAEGPGGFIEAIARTRFDDSYAKYDKYYGMTLLDTDLGDTNIPSWKKSADFLREFPDNVVIENGADGTGNILRLQNFEHVVTRYAGKMDIVTADGGFDFSMDFNQQEIMIGKLLFAQIAYGLCLQRQGGTFVLKIFDCFMHHTIDLLELLASFYDKTYIVKPQTSRYANSEKYVVCVGFLPRNMGQVYQYLHKCFVGMTTYYDDKPLRFLSKPTSSIFLQKIEEYNAIFGQKQIQNIHYTMSLMENKNKYEKIDLLIKTNIKKSIEWCIKCGIPHNAMTNTNMFVRE